METELFQWVLLALLGLGLIVLIALVATLGGIRKALERRGPTAATPAADPVEPAPADRAAPGEAASLERAAGTEEPHAERASASTGRAHSIRSVLEQHGLSDAPEAQQQAAAAQQPAAHSDEPALVDSVFAAHADDPQEEPFQRDGRWWFRRGDDLLLYDEASGQWQPAPESSPSGGGGQDTAMTGSTGPGAAETGVRTTPVSEQAEVADQVATFWKCPTCGAVNGSTASTCRMCFAARP